MQASGQEQLPMNWAPTLRGAVNAYTQIVLAGLISGAMLGLIIFLNRGPSLAPKVKAVSAVSPNDNSCERRYLPRKPRP